MTIDSGNPGWPDLTIEASRPDESSVAFHPLRIMARVLCPDTIESVVMIGASRAFVRKLRRRRLAAYFAYWRALCAQVRDHLSAASAYHMIRLAMTGAAYRLGARVDPGPSLERLAVLIGVDNTI